MKLRAPRLVTFWIAVFLAAVGLLASLGTLPGFSGFAFWLVFVAFVLLALGNLLKGL